MTKFTSWVCRLCASNVEKCQNAGSCIVSMIRSVWTMWWWLEGDGDLSGMLTAYLLFFICYFGFGCYVALCIMLMSPEEYAHFTIVLEQLHALLKNMQPSSAIS